MKRTEATARERRFILYNYLIRNTSEGHVKTPKEIFDYLLVEHAKSKRNDLSVLFVVLNICHKILSLQGKTGTSERSCRHFVDILLTLC